MNCSNDSLWPSFCIGIAILLAGVVVAAAIRDLRPEPQQPQPVQEVTGSATPATVSSEDAPWAFEGERD